MQKEIFRILDANLNRSREGLRVCEEIARFILQDVHLTRELKNLRHKILRSIQRLPGKLGGLLESRATQVDVGRNIFSRASPQSFRDIFSANIQRVKEALRVLEEFSRMFNQTLGKDFSRMRFQIYEIEKKVLARL